MKKLIAVLALLIMAVVVVSYSSTTKAQEFTKAQKAELEQMFKEYISNHGKEVVEAVEVYHTYKEEEDRKAGEKKAKAFLESNKNNKDLPTAGNADGDITLIEFFDYNCGYCRKALDAIKTVLKEDDNLKVVFFDMPILGESSFELAKWSLAAQKQGKYFEYHQELLNYNGQKSESVLEKLAKKVDLDIEKLKKDKESKEIAMTLASNIEIAQEMGIRGTPGFIINGKIYPGYMPSDRIKDILAEERKK